MASQKIDERGFGLASGAVWGGLVLLTTLAANYFNYGRAATSLMMSIYPGYSVGVAGSLVGGLYGLVDGVVCGFIFAWLYNRFKG